MKLKLKKSIIILNILLVCVMVIHVGLKMFLHIQHPEYSTPVYVEMINIVYYLIPFTLINAVYFIVRSTKS